MFWPCGTHHRITETSEFDDVGRQDRPIVSLYEIWILLHHVQAVGVQHDIHIPFPGHFQNGFRVGLHIFISPQSRADNQDVQARQQRAERRFEIFWRSGDGNVRITEMATGVD